MLKFFKLKSLLILASIFFFVPVLTHAASLYLSPNTTTVTEGGVVSVRLMLNSEGKTINNAEAQISFPTNLLEVASISRSSSVLSMWVEAPSYSNSTGKINLNGGVPNPGFLGTGNVVTINFRAKKEGTAPVIFLDGAVRENDGLGTNVLTSKSNSSIKIEKKVVSKPVEKKPEPEKVKPKPVEESQPIEITIPIVHTPVVTEYQSTKFEDEYLIIRGTADPAIDVEINISNGKGINIITDHVFTNNDGRFTYVPYQKLKAGEYYITTRAILGDTFSEQTKPILIVSKQHKFDYILGVFSHENKLEIPLYMLIIITLAAIILLLFLFKHFEKHSNTPIVKKPRKKVNK